MPLSRPDTPPPLILTAALDAAAQLRFDGLRRRHFPAALNHLDAHLTLFHALPGAQLESIERTLARACERCSRMALQVTGLRSLGRGVAYALESEALETLRMQLAREFTPWLTPQDAQAFRAHVTIQNKVRPDAARALMAELSATFEPFACRSDGLLLWRYLGGPWDFVRRFDFAREESP